MSPDGTEPPTRQLRPKRGLRPSARLRLAPKRLVEWAFRRSPDGGWEVPDFAAYATAMTSGFVRMETAVAVFLLIAFQPLDVFIYPHEPKRFAISALMRVFVTAILIGGLRAGGRRERERRDPLPVWIAMLIAVVALGYFMAGWLGDPTTPYIHSVLLVPLLTVTTLVPLAQRAQLTFGVALTAMVAYFGPHPEYLRVPHLVSLYGNLAASCVMSVALGHALLDRTRREFHARLDLRRVSRTDPLTGVWNRGYFLARANEEILRARRSNELLAVLVLDLDRFKSVNDRFGHATGDAVLVDFAKRAESVLRRTDVLGRMGGEEFAVLLPDTPLVLAVEAAERLRRAVEDSARGEAGASSPLPAYTVSVGCATLRTEDPDVDDLLRRADHALYQAKGFGRNRVASESVADPARTA